MLIKKSIDNLIYSSVKVEGIDASFAQTSEIVENGIAENISPSDLNKIICIKHGYEYLLDNYQKPLTWELFSRYNSIIGKGNVHDAGSMRPPGVIHVGDYYPEDVSLDKFNRIVDTALSTGYDAEDIACQLLLNLAKSQFFHDGNKRSSLILANHYLAHEDADRVILVLDEDKEHPKTRKFLDILVDYYHDNISVDDASWDLQDFVVLDEEAVNNIYSQTETIDKLMSAKSEEAGFQNSSLSCKENDISR